MDIFSYIECIVATSAIRAASQDFKWLRVYLKGSMGTILRQALSLGLLVHNNKVMPQEDNHGAC